MSVRFCKCGLSLPDETIKGAETLSVFQIKLSSFVLGENDSRANKMTYNFPGGNY